MSDSIATAYKNTITSLKKLYPDMEARAMADRLFEHYFGLSPVQRVLAGNQMAEHNNSCRLDVATGKLLKHMPLQYVLGSAWFMNMEFGVNPSVLIPRPETEELVSRILSGYAAKGDKGELKVLDIGTGSGCIAISIKTYIEGSQVTAIDVSEDAIGVAAANAKQNNAEVTFIQADILDVSQWEKYPEFDLIVSNPPYVTYCEQQYMVPNVLDYEPHTALFVPNNDPLVFYRTILAFAKIKLNASGNLWFEINEKFGDELKELAISQTFKDVNIFFDIHGKSRFLHAVK